jgi:hypothetical protein
VIPVVADADALFGATTRGLLIHLDYRGLRISAQRGWPFQPIVDGISDERGRCFRLNVDDVSA